MITVAGIFKGVEDAELAQSCIEASGVNPRAIRMARVVTADDGAKTAQLRLLLADVLDIAHTRDARIKRLYAKALRKGRAALAVTVATEAEVDPVCRILEKSRTVSLE